MEQAFQTIARNALKQVRVLSSALWVSPVWKIILGNPKLELANMHVAAATQLH